MSEVTDARVHAVRPRHVRMIALGGIIGASLFVGSGAVIHTVGPAAVLSYLIGGLLVVLVMRMLGEMAVARPAAGSFAEYATEALGGWAGFTIGWLYWYFWVGVVAFEAVAGAKILVSWVPQVPQWLFSLVLLMLLSAANLVSARSFGETEFWLASLKIATIVVFLVIGVLFVLGLWPTGSGSLTWLSDDGFVVHGWLTVLQGVVLVIFSYFGTEIVTIVAAESENPRKTVAKATTAIVWRVLLFFVGSITLLVTITPWREVPTQTSPFAAAFTRFGIPAAETLVSIVVLTAALSVLNSGLFTASRMLFVLHEKGFAPRVFGRRTRKNVPWTAILGSSALCYVAVGASYLAPDTIFYFIINSAGAVALFVYAIVAVAQLRLGRRYRLDGEDLVVRMWAFPWLSRLTLALILGVLGSMIFVESARSQLYLSVLSLLVILAAYPLVARRRSHSQRTPLL